MIENFTLLPIGSDQQSYVIGKLNDYLAKGYSIVGSPYFDAIDETAYLLLIKYKESVK